MNGLILNFLLFTLAHPLEISEILLVNRFQSLLLVKCDLNSSQNHNSTIHLPMNTAPKIYIIYIGYSIIFNVNNKTRDAMLPVPIYLIFPISRLCN